MRRLRLGAAAIAAAVLVGTWTAAGATAKPAPTTTHLQTEINGLQRTVKALQRQVAHAESVASTANSSVNDLSTMVTNDGFDIQTLESDASGASSFDGCIVDAATQGSYAYGETDAFAEQARYC